MSALPTRQDAIDNLFDEFRANGRKDESLDEMFEAFDEVVYLALLEKLGYSNSSDEQKKHVRQKMNKFIIAVNFNIPALAHAEKILHSLGVADFKKAATYLEQLYVMRSTAFSEIQRKHAQKPREKDPLSKLLAIFISRKPDISAAEAIAQLESGNYSDVIVDFDEYIIEYSHPDGRLSSVNKSAIPARLSRLRNER
jgi:hypothetical protein